MFSSLLTLGLVAGADPTPPKPPAPPKVQMPRLTDGPAPLKPLSALTPAVRPAVSNAAPPPTPAITEQGIYPDYLSPDMWLLGLRALKPKPATVVPPLAKPEVTFRPSNTDALGRPHHWRHMEDAGWKPADKPLVERKIVQDVSNKWPKGLQPRETVTVKGKPVEYRPFETAPGRVNVGTAYPGQMPPASGFGPSFGRGLGWAAPLFIPSSVPTTNSPFSFPTPPKFIWDSVSLLSRSVPPKHRLVDTNLFNPDGTIKGPTPSAPKPTATVAPIPTHGVRVYDAPIGPMPKATPTWHPPMAPPKPAVPPKAPNLKVS